jgi:hypothetical protein
MRMNWSRVLLAMGMSAALAACSNSAATTSGSAMAPASTVTPAGYGAIDFGMTPQEGAKRLMRPLRPLNPGEEKEPCYYLFPDGDPHATFAFMVSEGQLARIDVSSPSVATAEGARVGDSEAQVLQLYSGRAQVQPHKYGGPNDHYLVVYDRDRSHALVFETLDGKVTRYRAGKLPEAEYVEGCS